MPPEKPTITTGTDPMTPDEFRAWRAELGLTQAQAAHALGRNVNTINTYETGKRREDGRPVIIPKVVRLACAAISLGIR